ncbi:unnamed protein product [Mytilus edulis]|uniref:Transmembrane protein n=1 Tax=Mytilus edulis TaxID=6550 RepID=A0A8S3S1S6_MYTED|nr:unnamed protein product [Mytilus edulis]
MPLPIDTALIPEELITQSPEKYMDQLINRIKIIQDIAKSNLEEAQQKSKIYYDKSTKQPKFKVRDHVLLKVEKVQTTSNQLINNDETGKDHDNNDQEIQDKSDELKTRMKMILKTRSMMKTQRVLKVRTIQIIGMPRFGFVFLPFLLFALLLTTSNADQQRLNYGVIFQKQSNVDFATDYWTHVYEIPMYLDLQHTLVTKCPKLAGYQCDSHNKMVSQINYMRSYMNSQIQETRSLVDKLVPKLNKTLIGKSKRSLLPFVGNIFGGLFGLATEKQLRKLATHINSLTSENNKISSALKQYGGSLTSFVTQTENRLDNAMKAIKQNHQAFSF